MQKIIGISQNRTLAGIPHVWDIVDADRAECQMSDGAKLTLRRTMSGQWHLGGLHEHRMYFDADTIQAAIGVVIYRKFAKHPDRTVRASQIARNMRVPRAAHDDTPVNFILVQSQSEEGTHYMVDIHEKSCTCPDHIYRKVVCKHLRAAIETLP